jgi:peroxin-7
MRVWDLRTPASASNHLTLQIPIHAPPVISSTMPKPQPTFPPSEALTHDWNKYRSTTLAAAGVDRIIRTFDIRQPSGPLQLLQGHEYAIRKVAWSPHLPDLLLSASYDMTCRIWNDGGAVQGKGGREIGRMGRHTEFATGVDWCLFGSEGWVASCGWDERLCVWDVRAFMH